MESERGILERSLFFPGCLLDRFEAFYFLAENSGAIRFPSNLLRSDNLGGGGFSFVGRWHAPYKVFRYYAVGQEKSGGRHTESVNVTFEHFRFRNVRRTHIISP